MLKALAGPINLLSITTQVDNGVYVPLIIAAGGGGRGYSSQAETQLEQMDYELSQHGRNGKSYAAGMQLAALARGGCTCMRETMAGFSMITCYTTNNAKSLPCHVIQPSLSPLDTAAPSLSSAFLPRCSVYRAFTIDEQPGKHRTFHLKS